MHPEMEMLRCAIVRGGTSKAVFIMMNEYPKDPAKRDAVILAVYGSPDVRQIDGLGGADVLTSKHAIISPSSRTDADVDYTFAQVSFESAFVDYHANCGNISSAVGPFAIDEGLVKAVEPITTVRIRMTNSDRILVAEVPVKGGKAMVDGDFAIDGVPGTGAKIAMDWSDVVGGITGKLMPTGNAKDTIKVDGVKYTVSIVDAGNPVVFVHAVSLNMKGTESPNEIESNKPLMETIEKIRGHAAVMCGLVEKLGNAKTDRFGMWFSRPGNGTSHPVHQQRFGIPGKTLLGADSHTPAAGGIGMLAIGAGGLEISMALTGQPFRLGMPEIWGIRLTGRLTDWVSAKDVILEILRRHDVDGGRGRIVEFYGPGVAELKVMDRHVIANMGVEVGAVTTIFPSDEETRRYLAAQGREQDWRPLAAEANAVYDIEEEIDLSALEPLIALPSSPGKVVPVREVEGQEIYQSYIGSSANPGYRDLAVVAAMVAGRRVAPGVSLDINPASRQALEQLIREGGLATLVQAGARLHQTGCNGCLGMGQAPAAGRRSLRTVPRNFPGRSGAKEDQVYLCSPETAAASALNGVITDPRKLGRAYPQIEDIGGASAYDGLIEAPLPPSARPHKLVKGPFHADLPDFEPFGDELTLPVLLKLGENLSTDEIVAGGVTGLSLWSSVPGMTSIAFEPIDESYVDRARRCQGDGHAIVAGHNYGQGSSREQAALAVRNLGARVVLAHSIARIHGENLVNYGVLPLLFVAPGDLGRLKQGTVLRLRGLHTWLRGREREWEIAYRQDDRSEGRVRVWHGLSPRQVDILLAGGAIPWMRQRRAHSQP